MIKEIIYGVVLILILSFTSLYFDILTIEQVNELLVSIGNSFIDILKVIGGFLLDMIISILKIAVKS